MSYRQLRINFMPWRKVWRRNLHPCQRGCSSSLHCGNRSIRRMRHTWRVLTSPRSQMH
ncbi:hypothetical protein BGX38DRAFT_1190955, partial [Terfezia claveryi]